MKIPFGTRSYKLSSLPVSAQRLVNWYAEPQPGDAAGQVILMPTPGLKAFATAGSGPIRAGIELGGVAYVISGTALYSVTSAGVATSLGSVIAASRYSLSSNGTEIMIAAGSKSYVYDTSNGLREIVSAGFLGADHVTYQDQYFITNKPNSAVFQISGLTDGYTWDAADIATAEGDPDSLVSVISDHRELWLMGAKTSEVWQNTGNATFPFERLTYVEKGCGAQYSVVKADNSLLWLGNDLIVYRAQGYSPVRVSDYGVEHAISSYTTTSDAFAWSYADQGHTFYVLQFPTENACWVLDLSTGLWHERETYNEDRYRVNSYWGAFGKHLVGDYKTGEIYEIDPDTYTDGGEYILRSTTSPPLGQYEMPTFLGRMTAEFDMGLGLTSGQGSDPVATLQWSDDGGRTWSSSYTRSIGKKGEYGKRAVWHRLGRFYKRVFRITVMDPVKAVLINVYAE